MRDESSPVLDVDDKNTCITDCFAFVTVTFVNNN